MQAERRGRRRVRGRRVKETAPAAPPQPGAAGSLNHETGVERAIRVPAVTTEQGFEDSWLFCMDRCLLPVKEVLPMVVSQLMWTNSV